MMVGPNCRNVILQSHLAKKFHDPDVFAPWREFELLKLSSRSEPQNIIKFENLHYIECTMQTLMPILYCSTIPFTTKVVSTLWACAPYTRMWIIDNCTIDPRPNPLPPVGKLGQSEADISSELWIGMGVCLVMPAFNIDTHVNRQISNRLNAAAAACRTSTVTEDKVNTVRTAMGAKTEQTTNQLITAIGRSISIEKSGKYNPEVTTSNLIAIDSLGFDSSSKIFLVPLFTQVRLVYSDIHMQSFKFGANILVEFKPYAQALKAKFDEDYNNCTAADQDLQSKPYAGMVDNILEARTGAKNSRVIYTGLLFHKRCVKGTPQEKTFDDYNIEGVAAHVQPVEDKTTCEAIAMTIPLKSVSCTLKMLAMCDIEQSEAILANYSAAEKDSFYKSLITSDAPGKWAEFRFAQEAKVKIREKVDQGTTAISNGISEAVRLHMSKVNLLPDPQQRQDQTAQLLEWEAGLRNHLDSIMTSDQILIPEEDPNFERVVAIAQAPLKECLKILRAGYKKTVPATLDTTIMDNLKDQLSKDANQKLQWKTVRGG